MKYFTQHPFMILLLLFFVQSCSSPGEKTNQGKTQGTKDTTSIEDTIVSEVDTLTNDTKITLTSEEKDSIIQNIHLLESTSYHNDEIDPSLAQKEWYGIFEKDKKTFIQKVNVTIENEYDPIVDPEGEKTGWKVTIDQGKNIVFLISGIQITEKEITNFDFKVDWLKPGDSLSFNFKNQLYKITATGEYPKGKKELYNIKDFELHLQRGSITQKLISIPQNDDAIPKVLWVGDLDQDGKLDFLINTANHYNTYAPTLYLSSFATEGELVKEVAHRVSVGC